MEDFDKYVIRIYRNDIFEGYVKKFKNNNNKKLFVTTKHINSAIYYQTIIACDVARIGLYNSYVDFKSDNENYTFEIYKINIKEIRKSKLKSLYKTNILDRIKTLLKI